MAQQVIVRLTDDIDGESTADETVTFALDGRSYVIDVSARHAQEIRDALAPFIPHARAEHRKPGSRTETRSKSRRTTDPETTKAIRRWAAGEGIQLSPRGRLPVDVIERYHRRPTAA